MAVVECRLYQRGERLYVHADRVCSGLGGALPKEIMIRGGWKSAAMVLQYAYTSEVRDAFLARALNRHTEGSDVVQSPCSRFNPKSRNVVPHAVARGGLSGSMTHTAEDRRNIL